MSRSSCFSVEQIMRWAERQLADFDARTPGTLFADGVELSVAQAYQLQSAVTTLRCDRGEKVVGYKVGCTSAKIRKQLGIDHCVTGRLFDSEQSVSGSALWHNNFANLAIEGELAVELSCEPSETSFDAPGLPNCVARVFPVIELHHHVMRGKHPTAGELIANNAIHAGVVAGEGVAAEAISPASLDSWGLSIFADDQLLDRCDGPCLSQTIGSSLKWLAKVVRDRGDRLRKGQIILTGSIPSLFPIENDCCIQVAAPPLGSVSVSFSS